MAGSHMSMSAREGSPELGARALVSTADRGLPERLAGRVDGHLEAFAEHMRGGL